jgi:HlyD family type I secretion membrane fusion protein
VIDAQYLRALARHARLIAEVSNAPSITWPSEISERSHEPLVRQLKSFETDLLLADRDFMAGRREILEARIQELGNLSDAFRARIQGLTKQVALFEDEEKDVAQLVKSGFERRPRMLQLQRELAEKQGELDSDRATLLGLKEEAQGAKQELANLAYERRSEVFSQMLEAESSVAELVDRRRSAFSVLKNTEVLAPESGTVVDIRFFGAGGVVRPGEVLFDLVPTPDALLVKAKVRPEDIDVVYVGQEAAVRLLAHQLRMPEPFDGRVTLISADRLTDATDQNPHFEVFVEINKVAAKASQGVALQPGMSADVVLTTQQRTFLEYLVSPITRALFRGFREP